MNAAAETPRMTITLSPGCVLEPLPARAVASFSARPSSACAEAILARVIAGVMRNAQGGDLPLFAWTLGLPRSELMRMVTTLFPEVGAAVPPVAHEYVIILRGKPTDFAALVALLMSHRAAAVDRRRAYWLAHAIAAAAQGERHLWQDLGLRNRDEVSRLLACYFPTLHACGSFSTPAARRISYLGD